MEKSAEKLKPIITALTAARHRAGLSQRALADKVGLAQSHISKIERGAVDPQTTSVVEIARVLGLELSLVPTPLMPALQALIRESTPNLQSQASSLDHELTRLARRARALMRYLPNLKVLPGIALAADELRLARLDEASYAEARSSIAAAHIALSDLRVLSRGHPTSEAVRNAAEPLQTIHQNLRKIRNAWAHRDTGSPQSPAYRLDETDE
jgi:transcriptional regulator with XRE-family HTH domain